MSKKAVLIVDDDESFVCALQEVFAGLGWVAYDAVTPQRVLALVDEVDLVISNYGRRGYADSPKRGPCIAFEETRQLCELVKKPLILCTGGDAILDYPYRLEKPFEKADLVKLVHVCMTDMAGAEKTKETVLV